MSGSSNQPTSVLDRWQKAGDVSKTQKYTSDRSSAVSSQIGVVRRSDAYVTDASYLRLKNISISYRVPKNWLKKLRTQDFNFYIQGQNLLTLTNYKGADPETQGYQSLPPLKIICVGIKLII